MATFWPTAQANATVASSPSHASDIERGPTTPSTTDCNPKSVTVTLSTAPRLNTDDTIEKDSLCEICLEDIKDGQNILKTSCCRLLTHRRCLSVWAHTKNRGPLVEGRSWFTCPKCRTKMDLAKYRRQLPPLRILIREPRARPSYDIDATFTPLPQPQNNLWERLAPGPGHLRRSDLFLDLADAALSSQPHSTDQIPTSGRDGHFTFEWSADGPGQRHDISSQSEPMRSQTETERLPQDSTRAEAGQRYQSERQSQFQTERLRRDLEQYRHGTSTDDPQRQFAEFLRQDAELRTREAQLQREAAELRRQLAELERREAQLREREAEENQRQEAAKEEQEAARRYRQDTTSRQQQANRERDEAAHGLQIAERIRRREVARQNAC
jgi:Ring finger domain